jgi:hypothetical protein
MFVICVSTDNSLDIDSKAIKVLLSNYFRFFYMKQHKVLARILHSYTSIKHMFEKQKVHEAEEVLEFFLKKKY